MSIWGDLFLQDSNSNVMINMIMFHDLAMMVIMMIIMLIFYMIIFMMMNMFIDRFIIENQMIEIIWTGVPMLFLLVLALPSLKLLYLSDEIDNSILSIKIIGHQWYWSYEMSDFEKISFDSFMINSDDKVNMFRLLDVDNRLILPNNIKLRLLVMSSDVIHSFALPSMGIKIDAVPGRINQIGLSTFLLGLYYGQCSEICGVNHSFMPIVLEITNLNNFMGWIKKMSSTEVN